MKEAGIYIHIPFCAAKCPYCNFYSLPHSQSQWQEYADTLCQVLEDWQGRGVTAKTLYFGGGTPSLLPAELLLQIKNTVCRVFGQPEEITLEANPGLCTPEKLRRLRQGGFDRISFGVQSLEEKELKLLGRLHSPQQAEQAIWQAAQAGFSNLSADVMLAIPGQTEQSLEHTLSRLTALPITHLSAYLLKAEPGTPFYTPDILALTQDEERCRALYLKPFPVWNRPGSLNMKSATSPIPVWKANTTCCTGRGRSTWALARQPIPFSTERDFAIPTTSPPFWTAGEPIDRCWSSRWTLWRKGCCWGCGCAGELT